MKNIFRQAGIILGLLGLWYLFFLFLTYLFYPDSGVVDDNQAHRGYTFTKSIYPDGGSSVDLGVWLSKNAPHRIIIIGSSNAQGGIRPTVLQTLLPDFAIYNGAIGGSNVTQLREILDVVRMSSPQSMKGTIFVAGIFYGTFFNDNVSGQHVLWKNKDLTIFQSDGLRYGLYKPKDNKLELTLEPHLMPWAVRLLRPFLFWHCIFVDVRSHYVDFWDSFHSMTGMHEGMQGEELKQSVLAQWKVSLGDIKGFAQAQQMNSFLELCQEIIQSGASLVIVDLPVPQWVREKSAYYKKYILNRPLYINGIKNIPRVRYIDLGTSLPGRPDSDFSDSVHPTKEAAEMWSKTIADFVVSQRRYLGF